MEGKIFRISLRLSSKSYDFREMIPQIVGYRAIYYKNGESLYKDSSFKLTSNVLVLNDCYVGGNIDGESSAEIMNALLPLIEALSRIETDDLSREIFIIGMVGEQFRFSLNHEFVTFLTESGYSLSFSGVACQ